MDRKRIRGEIEHLRREIQRHTALYCKHASPVISDEEYDALERRLRELETAYPELAVAESPTRQVGSDHDARFASAPHSRPMLSLANSYDPQDVEAFVARIERDLGLDEVEFTVEPKIDGVALAVRYRDGLLDVALTRGDGFKGDVITANIRTMAEIPEELAAGWEKVFPPPYPRAFEVRGEAYLGLSRFRQLNRMRAAEGLEPLANPRNATAGTLKTLDSSVVAARGLSVGVYNVPITYPPNQVNGYMVSGEMGAVAYDESMFQPPELFEELRKVVPRYEIAPVHRRHGAEFDLEALRAQVDARRIAAAYLLEHHPTDVFITVINYVDHLQHRFASLTASSSL